MTQKSAILGLLALLLPGCANVDAAPKDVDGLAHYFWQHFEDGDDASLIAAVRNTHRALVASTLEEPVGGTISDLDQAEAALAGLEDRAVEKAQGLYMARTFSCGFHELEELIYELDQGGLHPDAYDHYERRYSSDFQAYTSRETAFLSWDVDYTTIITGATYSSQLQGELRYVPDVDDGDPNSGPALLQRTTMPEPADFEEGSDYSLVQDYQIELFYQPTRQRIVHFYALWREGVYTFGWDMSNESVQALIIDSMADWDDDTARACE